MPLLTKLRNVSKCSRILRYGNSLNSSHRHLIETSRVAFKPRRAFHCSLKAFEKTFDHNLKVNSDTNRNYRRLVASEDVNNSRNMTDATEKENDDISLPFWVFLWSILAILAGFIYIRLNKREESEYEQKSEVHHTVKDEQIARKLVNEISIKDSGKQRTFRRQRSYEIIDGEVRIHYDISMLDVSLQKRTNIEGILQKAEVESIPIRGSSLDELELIYPGNLPRIIEEGEEELESPSDEQNTVHVNEAEVSLLNTQIYKDKSRENPLSTAKKETELNFEKNKNNSSSNVDYFEAKQGDLTSHDETISEEKLIPTTQSTSEAIIITVNPQKDDCSELSVKSEINLYVNENAQSSDELSSTSEESVIENLSPSLSSSKNSLHSSNSTSTSVYKLTELEKSEGHNFVVTRRKVTKLNSGKESFLESNSFKNETSFPFADLKESQEIADFDANCSQILSWEVQNDTSPSQQDLQITQTHLYLDKDIESVDLSFLGNGMGKENCDSKVTVTVQVENFDQKEQELNQLDYHGEQISTQEDKTFQESLHQVAAYTDKLFDQQESDSVDLQEDLPQRNFTEVVSGNVYKSLDSSLNEPHVLTYLEEGSDILVDNTGDFLFKVIGRSVEDEYLDDIAGTNKKVCGRNVVVESEEFVLDENENCQMFDNENELIKNWKSLPLWDTVHSYKDCGLDSGSLDLNHTDDEKSVLSKSKVMVGDSENVHRSLEGKNNEFCEAVPVLNQDSDSEVTEDKFGSNALSSSGISDDKFHMKNAEEPETEAVQEASLLKFENKIGTRKTIFVRDAIECTRNDESVYIVETRLDISSDATAVKSTEEVSVFRGKQKEQEKPDTLDCDISDEILVVQAAELNEVEDKIFTRGQTDYPVTFAKASMVSEEDVLVAKIMTVVDPEPKTDNLSSTNTSTEQNFIVSMVTNSESEIKTNSSGAHTPPDVLGPNFNDDTGVDEGSTENNLAHSDVSLGSFKPSPKTVPTSTNNGAKTVTKVTRTTVHSIVKKFEEAEKPNTPLKAVDGDKYLNRDIPESTVQNESQSENKTEVESQSKEISIGGNMDSNFIQSNEVKDTKGIDNGRIISEQGEVQIFFDESAEAGQSKYPNTDINTDRSSADPINSSIVFIHGTHHVAEHKPSSAKDICSNDLTNRLKLKSDTETNNVCVVGDLVEEQPDDIVIYANQVTEHQVTAYEPYREEYGIGQTREDTNAKPIDCVVISGDATNTGKGNDGVIYANQVCEAANIAETFFESKTQSKLPSLNNNSLTNDSAEKVKEKSCTTVVYQSSELEFTSQTSTGSTSFANKKMASSSHIAEEQQILSEKNSQTDLVSTFPTSPKLNYESRSFTETSFDELPSTSTVISKSSSERKENVFRGETDVDSLSDVDEVDFDVSTDDKYQKSKSVTDLDEALASFGGIDYLLDDDNMSGGLSKSVPDILDSCREETLKETVANPAVEKLQKKTLSLSTPEIASKGKPGSKKVTKIKIIHVKFLETKDDSDSENIEEDSFIYDGDVPISGKMKRRSRNLSPELTSPVRSVSPEISREIAQERLISQKANLKQLEFEFGDLFQSSPSPPPVHESNDSLNNGSNQVSRTVISKDIPKFQGSSVVYSSAENLSSGTAGQVSTTMDISKSTLESQDVSLLDHSAQRSSSSEASNRSLNSEGTTKNSRFEKWNQRIVSTQNTLATEMYRPTTTTAFSSAHVTCNTNLKPDIQKRSENIIPASSVVTKSSSSTETRQQISTTIRPSRSKETNSKVEYKNFQDTPSLALTSSETVSNPFRKTDSRSYRYTPGNTHSYSKVPKPVPEQGKYVVKSGVIATQSTAKQTDSRNIVTQAKYNNSPHSSSPASSPRHGIKLSEKFHMSDEGELGQPPRLPSNQTDGPKSRKSNYRAPSNKPTSSRPSGRLVTVKSGIISDYECSSDADSEMSYNVPSPRVKAKRYCRPPVHRDTLDSASSSEPDSPRRGQIKDDRRSMSELFGVMEEQCQYSSDASWNKVSVSKESELQSSSRDEKLFSKFGNVGQNGEKATTHHENLVEINPSPSDVRVATFDRQPEETRSYNPHYTSPLERNLSPTSFLLEGNLMSDDQMSPRTMEFNPFEELEGKDGFQPFERCHSPSSVYSDTSSVFSFNCDFDPMPPPNGKFEPEVYTCENQMCGKQDILLGPEKTSFKSCPACFTYYCSSQCRKLHWPSHKQVCYFGRVNTYVRSIIRLCQRREDLSMNLSQLARDGYKKKGRGVVMAIFNSPDLAREFITKGHDAFSGRKPTYSSLPELNREGIISKHRVALMQAVRDYEPNEEFVFNIAVVATNNIPINPTPRYKLNTVLHCIKMPLNEMIVARQQKDYDKIETRLFALPKCSRHEFVNEMEARRHYCRNLSKNLRQYNIRLKEDYPECYRKLCMYVEHNISFEPMTVYGQRSGLSYRCVIAPEQSYPLNAEYC